MMLREETSSEEGAQRYGATHGRQRASAELRSSAIVIRFESQSLSAESYTHHD